MPIDLEGEIAREITPLLPADVASGVTRFSPGEYKTLNPGALGIAQAVLARLDALGLVVVPKEPTEAMVNAGNDHLPPASVGNEDSEAVADAYRAMISASKP